MSIILRWRTEYETGHRKIDNEHRAMFMLAQRVFDSWAKPGKPAEGHAILILYRYVRTHFEHEEAIMQERRYPGLSEHKQLHDRLTSGLDEVANPQLAPEHRSAALRRLMFEWIVEHITVSDKAFADFLKTENPTKPQG